MHKEWSLDLGFWFWVFVIPVEALLVEDQRPKTKDPRLKALPPKTLNHALINLSRQADIVKVIFANQVELARLIKIKNFAAFHLGRLARFDPKCPCNIIKTNVPLRTEPPTMHGVEHSANVVFAKVYEGSHLHSLHQTSLEDKRQIETNYVVTDQFI
jgi:hypothetical protein